MFVVLGRLRNCWLGFLLLVQNTPIPTLKKFSGYGAFFFTRVCSVWEWIREIYVDFIYLLYTWSERGKLQYANVRLLRTGAPGDVFPTTLLWYMLVHFHQHNLRRKLCKTLVTADSRSLVLGPSCIIDIIVKIRLAYFMFPHVIRL